MAQERPPHPDGSLAERILGVDDLEDELALSRAHYRLTGEQKPSEDLIAEAGELMEKFSEMPDREVHTLDPEVSERVSALNVLVTILAKRKMPYFTFLGAWPAYEDLYAQQEPPQRDDRSEKALLIGSQSTLTSASFAAFSEDVIRAQPVIADPCASEAKRRHGTFVQENGLALPGEWTESMQSVMTNILMPMLLDTEGNPVIGPESEQSAMRTLLQQTFRVLRPGGSLLMYELPPRFKYDDLACETPYNQDLIAAFADTLGHELGESGFEDINIGEGWGLSGVDYLFDRQRAFATYDHIPLPQFRTIYARRPDHHNY